MYKINFDTPVKVHFIGIGGISMSAIAEILISKGFSVSGSDAHESELTDKLTNLGAYIIYGQSDQNITNDIDVVVYTAAINPENPEFKACISHNIPMLTRAEMLGQIMEHYKTAIGVSGTHGKTTTTSMLSHIFLEEDSDPTILVGGILNSIHGNLRIGSSETFLTEACEYTNSFLSLSPTTAVILNVKEDHLDFFKDIDDIRHSFREYAKLVPEDGYLIINSGISKLESITNGVKCNIITFGLDSKISYYSAGNIEYDEFACPSYDLLKQGKKLCRISLNVTGLHNVSNSLAAVAAAHVNGVDLDTIVRGLQSYTGTNRRFELKGTLNGVTIIDDYAHHPDEINATLEAAKKYPHRDIWCVFQPHTYSRTKSLMNEFAKSLSVADKVVLADIYAARETDNLGISSETLMHEIKKYNPNAYYFDSFEKIQNFLLENCINGDLLITMGAGDVVKIGENLLK